ncbi:(d)CMP kinase [Sphingomonas sp. LHG3443-2]|uniref:(d)CMP kinase n=1 Tax=Sphingomonas sp. LHG3443-2 TaxID=2804639 RepID=UPI003CF8CB84
MPSPSLVIAVDGPAASGKGTIARGLARHFALPFLDTGKLYRAVALSLLRWGGDPDSEFAALRACEDIAGLMDDPELKSEMVGGIASRVSAYPAVRTALLDRQREFAATPGGAVLDGRDIGTVIAPNAAAKLFVTAAIDERARRRHAELTAAGLPVHLEDILIDLRARDERDAGRDAAPLLMAEDAMLLDTSAMNPDEALAEAIRLVEGRRRP